MFTGLPLPRDKETYKNPFLEGNIFFLYLFLILRLNILTSLKPSLSRYIEPCLDKSAHSILLWQTTQGRVTETDHAVVQRHVNLKFEIQKPQRIEAYNFKSDECRKY